MAEHTTPELTDADDAALGEHLADLDRGTGQWVSIVYMDGDDFDVLHSETDATPEAMAEYLTQWDMGAETDDAHTTDGGQWGTHDTVTVHTIGGLTYVLAVNYPLNYASLNRRPLS